MREAIYGGISGAGPKSIDESYPGAVKVNANPAEELEERIQSSKTKFAEETADGKIYRDPYEEYPCAD